MNSLNPSYITLHQTGELEKRSYRLEKILDSCRLCPRECGINRLKGDSEVISFKEMACLDPGRDVLIDLRNKDELDESGRIDGAVHIPLDELRDRLDELDKNKRYILFCAVGLRGYIGYRILSQHGFDVRNLSGGFKTWLGASEKIMAESKKTPLWRAE